MAIIKCKECGEDVSNKAKTCPNCGVAPRKKTSLFTWIIFIFIIWIVYISNNSNVIDNYKVHVKNNDTNTKINTAKEKEKPSWIINKHKNEMTGDISYSARSPIAHPTVKMDFPYKDIYAYLGFSCSGTYEALYFHFSDAPNLSKTRTGDGYNSIDTNVKWDESIKNISMYQEWGSKTLRVFKPESAIKELEISQKSLLSLQWYGQGTVYFNFSLEKAQEKISELKSLCGIKK